MGCSSEISDRINDGIIGGRNNSETTSPLPHMTHSGLRPMPISPGVFSSPVHCRPASLLSYTSGKASRLRYFSEYRLCFGWRPWWLRDYSQLGLFVRRLPDAGLGPLTGKVSKRKGRADQQTTPYSAYSGSDLYTQLEMQENGRPQRKGILIPNLSHL